MTEVVKSEAPPARGHRQAARTQVLVVEAASRLFVDRGYTTTTIEDIAAAADVGARTIYVRFGTKAALLKRVIDVAIVGDTDEVDVLGRDWLRPAMTAPTLDERIAALASANRQIMERAGALFAVAQQAAAVEPLIAQFWQQGRDQHQHGQRVIWNRMAEDSLLPASCDLEWLIDSASVLTAAETYLLITRMQGWSLAVYQAWLARTLAALPTAPVS
ncbi:MAG TPA: helix-turn-helix domain-containing protein [Actinomycetota bacterium]|nr:helix-turn-helix domain-containing protein [Actinomycetota bacterium]